MLEVVNVLLLELGQRLLVVTSFGRVTRSGDVAANLKESALDVL